MCRIAGIFNPEEQYLGERIVAMRDTMYRGGPDSSGVFVHPQLPLALGHRRLSLIDLTEAGHQPMIDAELTIVFNGEIYNYKELRATLQHYGHTFRTESDTEVILKAYRQWGVDAFEYFNGMFALAIWDEGRQQLLLARDHAGIKPLYYYIDGKSLYFASEIRAFAHSGKNFAENSKWRSAFLTFGHLPEPITTLKDVVPLQKGTALLIDLPTLHVQEHRFFEWTFNAKLKQEEEAIKLLRETLEEAVARHLVADAPIGLFLSGGIDSSLLTLIASHTRKDNLHTLSIVFNEQAFSEEKYQRLIIEKTGAKHQSFLVTKDIFNQQLADAMQAMDQPTLDGINTYFISMYAKAYGLKAVLSGLGADELFGGYPSFQQQKKMELVEKMPERLLRGLQHFPDHRVRKLSYIGMQNSAAEYLSYRGIFTPVSVASLLDASEAEIKDDLAELSAYYPVKDLKNGNRISWLETNFYMQNQLLKDSDFMSMWHGLEIRVPFLDKEVMLMAAAIDPAIKFKKVPPKYPLVKAFEHALPEAIWKRKKQGFTFPFEGWLKENEYIRPSNGAEEKLYRLFQQKKLSWGRYWCALLMNRFEERI
ncbi:asparagine synthase (glutamine-hydrolysing) [Lacibacter cauensis]|uniref:asparagine synthase (glutamine-hydrolyzing) n=1 Tax=Lacibacter cauensis TaxID=510947 RepID=A0A562SJI2_9BACT|nr:asparagine synthase (glutamine-hydrolyzing) [Lacibacter cauensis]TWI81429.1 asparagine synthase (glutamine-hydrolysing) [Lacibacter cauensis]